MEETSIWDINRKPNIAIEIPEQKKVSTALVVESNTDCIMSLINRISNYSKVLRITAFILRFTQNCKFEKISRQTGPLTISELDTALIVLIKSVQLECFSKEYQFLTKGIPLPSNCKILHLKPFLLNGVIRVGGRLVNSDRSLDQKHQILLPKHHLTELIIRHRHVELLHCGTQMLLCSVRERFWPIDGKNICKKSHTYLY